MFVVRRLRRSFSVLLGCLSSIIGCAAGYSEEEQRAHKDEARVDDLNAEKWKQTANETHDYIARNLLTPSGSYRTTPGEDRTDQWHCMSQLGADVALLRLGDQQYLPFIDRTAAFMPKLWETTERIGGYYATSAADGSNVARPTRFVDDNSLAGVIWLDARDAVADADRQNAYLASARSVANFLIQSGVWDDTFGGGFWWNTERPDKPTQSNGLAAELMIRLGEIGGEPFYKDWAMSIMTWLDTVMFDSAAGLYSWKRDANGRNDAKFTYDQAIMIDVQLALHRTTKDERHLAKARQLADGMIRALWDVEHGGFVISSEDHRLSPVFSGWATVSLVNLFKVDKDPRWLNHASENARVLIARLRDPKTLGFFASVRPDGTNLTAAFQAVDQAWMQRALASLATVK